jgi:hypothetical protein
MLIQLDAAQVIDLTDGDEELRDLLRGHQCVVSSSIVLDLYLKSDQPAASYHGAFRDVAVLWSIDAGMLCNAEIETGIQILRSGRTARTRLESSFPFRVSLVEAIAVRLNEAIPEQS